MVVDEQWNGRVVFLRSCRWYAGRDGNPALTAFPDGRVQAAHFGEAEAWQQWHLEVLGREPRVFTSTSHHQSSRPSRSNATRQRDHQVPSSSAAPTGSPALAVALRSTHGRYLAPCPDGVVRADSDKINACATWLLLQLDGGMVALRSHDGLHLRCCQPFAIGEIVQALKQDIGEWEMWNLTDSPKAFTEPGSTQQKAALLATVAGGFFTVLAAAAMAAAGSTRR